MTFECTRCGYTTNVKCNITKHINRKKICKPKLSNIIPKEYIDEILKGVDKKPNIDEYECEHCSKSYTRKDNLKRHLELCSKKPDESLESLKELVKTLNEQLNVTATQLKNKVITKSKLTPKNIPVATIISETNHEQNQDQENNENSLENVFQITPETDLNNINLEFAEELKKVFNDEEQEMFSESFSGYLHYDQEKDFVVDFDSVWKWIGFDNKWNAKRLLLKYFTENKDFIIQKAAPPIGGAKKVGNIFEFGQKGFSPSGEKPPGRDLGGKINIREKVFEYGQKGFPPNGGKPSGKDLGGRPTEKILLNVLTFKKFCMIAGTKKSHKIYDYYIKMELVLHNFLRKKIKEQNKKLELKDRKLELKDKQKEKNLIENFDNKPVVYLISIEKDVVMFGYTNDMKRRLREHKHDIGKHIRLEHCIHSIYNREIESNIKKSIDLYTLVLDSVKKQIIKKSRIFSKEYREKNQTELIKIDKEFTLEKLFKLVTSVREKINYVEVIDKLNISNMQLLNVIKELNV